MKRAGIEPALFILRLSVTIQDRWMPFRLARHSATATCGRFCVEQSALSRQAPAVAGERAVGAHDAMARYQQCNPICCAGTCYGSRGFWIAQLSRQLRVASRFAAWNFAERLPDAQLKDGPAQVEFADANLFSVGSVWPAYAAGPMISLAHGLERRIHMLRKRRIAAQRGGGELRTQTFLGFRFGGS